MIVIDGSQPEAERFLENFDVLKKRSKDAKLPFQIYLADDKVIGFGIQEPDRVGLSQSGKEAYFLVPISASRESLREFAELSLKNAKEKNLGYVYVTIDADRKEIVSSLEEGGMEELDEYFWMSRSLESLECETESAIGFDRVTNDNFQLCTQIYYEAFKDSPDRLAATLIQKFYASARAKPEVLLNFKEYITKPDHYAYIVRYRGKPAGILDLGKTFLNAIGLLPECRGLGIGRHSMLFAMNKLRCWGQESIGLRVDAENAPAIRLYRRLGFSVDKHKIRLFRSLE